MSIRRNLYQYIPINISVYFKISLYTSIYLNTSQYISMYDQQILQVVIICSIQRSVSIFSIQASSRTATPISLRQCSTQTVCNGLQKSARGTGYQKNLIIINIAEITSKVTQMTVCNIPSLSPYISTCSERVVKLKPDLCHAPLHVLTNHSTRVDIVFGLELSNCIAGN